MKKGKRRVVGRTIVSLSHFFALHFLPSSASAERIEAAGGIHKLVPPYAYAGTSSHRRVTG